MMEKSYVRGFLSAPELHVLHFLLPLYAYREPNFTPISLQSNI